MVNESTALVPTGQKLPKSVEPAVIARSRMLSANDVIGHISMTEVEQLINATIQISRPKFRERNRLLIKMLVDSGARVSEVLRLRPIDVALGSHGGARIRILAKGNKPREAAISAGLARELKAFAFESDLTKTDRFWPINRRRAHQIVSAAMEEAGIRKPERVGSIHVLRHTCALERMRLTGNPRAVQHQLGHKSGEMTLRYQKTLEIEGALQIQESVELW